MRCVPRRCRRDALGQHTGFAPGPAYNRRINRRIARKATSTPRARTQRAVSRALLVEIALAALIPALPGAPGAVRVAGVSLLWWYAGVVAPVLSALAVAVLRR